MMEPASCCCVQWESMASALATEHTRLMPKLRTLLERHSAWLPLTCRTEAGRHVMRRRTCVWWGRNGLPGDATVTNFACWRLRCAVVPSHTNTDMMPPTALPSLGRASYPPSRCHQPLPRPAVMCNPRKNVCCPRAASHQPPWASREGHRHSGPPPLSVVGSQAVVSGGRLLRTAQTC